jgi:hypothetical protein
LEWIKVTKPDSQDETEGTATDRLTQSPEEAASEAAKTAPPAEEKREVPPESPVETAPPTPPEGPAQEPPLSVTSTTVAVEPEEAEQHLKEAAGKVEASTPVEIPLFEKLAAEEKKTPEAPSAPPQKPTGRTLGLEEVPAVEAPGDAASLDKAATTPPAGVQVTEQAGHSVNFMAPGVGKSEPVEAPVPKEAVEKTEEPVVSAPAVLQTPKAEEVSTECAKPPAAPAESRPAEAPPEPERVHVGTVDLRVERRQIPVPPVTKAEQKEQPISFASVMMYICILLLAVLVLSAFFGNKSQVTKVRQELQSIKQQMQQMPNAGGGTNRP